MKKINEMLTKLQVKALCALSDFKDSERGDTNFVSMLLIIGIVVVLAGLFLTLGREVMTSIGQKVKDFIASLG